MFSESLMNFEEKISYQLRSLYLKYGYVPYKMSKFEEYELYVRNKEFLESDKVITFNDTNGKLMALKPDVTLSIIKNGEDQKGCKQKVFYNENVYRVSPTTNCFTEIMQSGLECIGDIDIYDIYEVITLAAESLASISENFFIEISNLDLVVGAINSICSDNAFVSDVINCISEKNNHDLKRICNKYGISEDAYNKLSCFVTVYGNRSDVLSKLLEFFDSAELSKLTLLSDMLSQSTYSDKIKFDFSVVNDMSYYNGFIFRGFVNKVNRSVLTGGQYDNMMKKIYRQSGAIGFAIYLDRMKELCNDKKQYSTDYLILYDDSTPIMELLSIVNNKIADGALISVQKSIPEKLQYKEIIDLRKKD